MKGTIELESQVEVGSKFTMRIPLIFTKERADSTTSSNLGSRRNSTNQGPNIDDEHSPLRKIPSSETSLRSEATVPPGLNGFDAPAKPRLVGLSQPFFAATSPLESPDKQLAAMERVAAQAAQSGDRVRVLVAEDNKVNQEVVLRMLKLEDIYGTLQISSLTGGCQILTSLQMSLLRRTARKLSSLSRKAWSSGNSLI